MLHIEITPPAFPTETRAMMILEANALQRDLNLLGEFFQTGLNLIGDVTAHSRVQGEEVFVVCAVEKFFVIGADFL